MTPLISGTDMDLDNQSTVELMKQAGIIGGGGILSIAVGYLALVKTSLITRPKTIAEQASYIEKLHTQLNVQAELIKVHEKKFVEMNKYITDLRSELATQRGVDTQEIKQPEALS